ncbi:hypothetical protein DSCA_40480 [Desulfosarcina alkanivorans]|uniref:Uncharacterized protein n=1 Tax=Desulfosarcina alkanivorans TaxID=571177 RepID=A0A5K7YMS4_9BACT|nr:hypothetical protein DSCA_40480 [Desulfosarcina alkanivorans]
MVKPGSSAAHFYLRQDPRRKKQFPGNPGGFLLQPAYVGRQKAADAHENTGGRANVQVGPLAIHEASAKGHPAGAGR